MIEEMNIVNSYYSENWKKIIAIARNMLQFVRGGHGGSVVELQTQEREDQGVLEQDTKVPKVLVKCPGSDCYVMNPSQMTKHC